MIEPRMPKYNWGQRVLASADLYNDGSFPNVAEGELLVKSGEAGEVVNVGNHVETNSPVYLVEFADNRVVGCLEDELAVE